MLNKAQFIGRLTADPKCGNTNNSAYAFVSIACNSKYKDKDGNTQERVEYIDISFFSRLAEIISEYCHKGDLIYAEAKISVKNINEKGIKMKSIQIIGDKLRILTSPKHTPQQNITDEDYPE